MHPFDAYPLLVSYGIRRYAFGERRIADLLGKAGQPEGVIAETWEVSDHDDECAVVLDGAYRGRRLRELVEAFADEVVRPGWSGPLRGRRCWRGSGPASIARCCERLRAGAYDDVMLRYPVEPGDTILVPGGVLPAFGPDTLIVEVRG